MAIQAETVVKMVQRDVNVGPRPATNTASLREAQRQGHGGPAQEKLTFNWNAQDNYVEVLNCEMEVINFLQTKVYALTDEENIPVMKNWLGEGLAANKNLHECRKRNSKTAKGLFQ